MNRMTKAVLAGSLAGALHAGVMLFKGMSFYPVSAVFIQYIAGSVLIFYVPLKMKGWLKGLIVGSICALPLMLIIPRNEPTGSTLTGFLVYVMLGGLLGAYSAQEDESMGTSPSSRLARSVIAGGFAGSLHALVMILKNMPANEFSAVVLQYIISSVIIFYAPFKASGWQKGLLLGWFCSLPLNIVVPYYDSSGSLISGFIISGIFGSLLGAYSAHKEKK